MPNIAEEIYQHGDYFSEEFFKKLQEAFFVHIIYTLPLIKTQQSCCQLQLDLHKKEGKRSNQF